MLIAAWLTAAGMAGAQTTRYVAWDAVGAENGSDWINAYTNIQDAIDNSFDGDVILIKQGTYGITSQLSIGPGAKLTVRGGYEGTTPLPGTRSADPELTIVQRSSGTTRILYIDNAGGWIEGLTFRGGNIGAHGSGIRLETADTVFTNCVIRDNVNGSGSWSFGIGIYINGGSPVFERCVIRNNTYASNYHHGGGIYANNASVTMRHCVFRGNVVTYAGGAVYLIGAGPAGPSRMFNCLLVHNVSHRGAPQSEAGGIHVLASASLEIENCTIAYNVGLGVHDAGSNVTVQDSIIWGNDGDLSGIASDAVTYSCVPDTSYDGEGMIHSDPQFEFGYYLATGSDCIDAGSATAAALGLDTIYAQTSQTDSGTVDFGYHYPTGYTLTVPNLYVDADNGHDGNPGNAPGAGQAFKTLTHALANAQVGTTLHVASGTYDTANGETFPLVLNTDAVRILGTNAADTIIDASGSSQRCMTIIDVGPQGLVSNLTFRGGSTGGGGLYIEKSSLMLADCIIRDNLVGGGSGGGIFIRDAAPIFERCVIRDNEGRYGGGARIITGAATFIDCVVRGNFRRNDGSGQGGGFSISGGASVRIFNCLIVGNTGNSGSPRGYGVYVAGTTPVTIENCTIADNTGAGITGGSGVTVINSVIRNNLTDLAGLTVGNVTYSCAGDANYNSTGMIHADPQFEFGYYLAAGSECIDAGSDTAAALGLDGLYAQASQTDSSTVDMGYHYPEGYTLTVPELYVDANQAAEGDGSQGNPFKTLTNALAQARIGTTIHLANGTYDDANGETFPLAITDALDGLRIIGDDPEQTIISGVSGENVITIYGAGPNTLLRNLTITRDAGNNRNGLDLDRASPRVEHSIIRGHNAGSGFGGGVTIRDGNPVFVNCTIRDNWARYGYGIVVRGGSMTLRGCVIVNNHSTESFIDGAVAIWSGSEESHLINCLIAGNRGAGVYTRSPTRIENSTIADNTANTDRGVDGDASTVIVNSIVWGNPTPLHGVAVANVTYSCAENTGYDGEGMIHCDPHFEPDAGDYRLQQGISPCIDAGINQDWMVEPGATDLRGFPRVLFGGKASRVDMGAYETPPVNGTMLQFR